MLRKLSWYVFLIVGIVIGLGAFGHGYSAMKVHEAIDQFPIVQPIYEALFVVWYMASGVMLAFGTIIVWIAVRVRAGDASSLFVKQFYLSFYVFIHALRCETKPLLGLAEPLISFQSRVRLKFKQFTIDPSR